MALENSPAESGSVSRRTIIKGAAWAAPVMIAAVAVPSAVASVNNSALSWSLTAATTTLTRLADNAIVTAGTAVTLPTKFRLTNGPGAINSSATVSVVVSRPTNNNFSKGTTYGFGVAKLNGVDVQSSNTLAYAPNGKGFPATTFTGSYTFTAPSNGVIDVPIEFGLSGLKTTDGNVTQSTSFPVALTLTFPGGKTYTASTTILVPVLANIL